NRSGKYATPGLRGILAAASSDQKPDGNNALSIVNPPKKYKNAYPISTYTYVIVPLKSDKADALKKFIFWAVTKGQSYGPKLLFGTAVTSLVALAIAGPLSIGIALYLTELAPRFLRVPVTALVEMLAAVPSVVVGLWGILVLGPILSHHVEPFLHRSLGFIP